MRRVKALVANGWLYPREDLASVVARFRERFESPAYAGTMTAPVRMMPRPDNIDWPKPK